MILTLKKRSIPSKKLIQVISLNFEQNSNLWLGYVMGITVTPDSKYIISASYDQSIGMFDIETKKEAYYFNRVHGRTILKILISSLFNIRIYQVSSCYS